ncbi:MAG: HDIG domain-containing protein [Chlorobi bacterium]|nr:HDIG domain-containing protein [Chlorobiota bacterium]
MKKFLSNLRNHYADISKISLFVVTVVLLVLIFPKEGRFKYEFRKGKPWMHQDLIAPFDFAVLKSAEEIAEEEEAVLKQLKPYFRNDLELVKVKREKLIQDFNSKWSSEKGDKRRFEKKKEDNLRVCLKVFDSIMQKGIIELTPQLEGKPGETIVNVIINNVVSERNLGEFFTIRSADSFIHSFLNSTEGLEDDMLKGLLENSLFQNIRFDPETTENEKKTLLNGVSLTRGMVQSGERIISKGELITPAKFQVLESLRKDYEANLGGSAKTIGIMIGQIILMAVALVALLLFILFFRTNVYAEGKNLVLILMVILFMVLVTELTVKFNPAYVYLIPVCIVPIIISVFYDTRLALFVHLIVIILTGSLVPNSFEYIFLQLFTGIITILSIVKLERRSQFFFTSLMIFISYSVIYTGMNLIEEGSVQELKLNYFLLFGGSAVLTLFSYPIIFIFEKVFGLITNVTLLELSNTNNKILRELSLKAPGTFQHSMQMANLAEAATYAIGGNPLLVRTGAMYHDIGKTRDPLYFIENQSTGVNPHDELTYEESAAVIIDHIVGGVEKAKKLKLPEQIIDFIRTHHGTRRAEYFYMLAKRDNIDEEVDESIYTYPGPEPFSKETAVLMMADAVEAASRTLKVPDEDSINKLVENIINKQIESRQFDNADITFRDIKTIKKVFKKKLMNIYHLRIEYPE